MAKPECVAKLEQALYNVKPCTGDPSHMWCIGGGLRPNIKEALSQEKTNNSRPEIQSTPTFSNNRGAGG